MIQSASRLLTVQKEVVKQIVPTGHIFDSHVNVIDAYNLWLSCKNVFWLDLDYFY